MDLIPAFPPTLFPAVHASCPPGLPASLRNPKSKTRILAPRLSFRNHKSKISNRRIPFNPKSLAQTCFMKIVYISSNSFFLPFGANKLKPSRSPRRRIHEPEARAGRNRDSVDRCIHLDQIYRFDISEFIGDRNISLTTISIWNYSCTAEEERDRITLA